MNCQVGNYRYDSASRLIEFANQVYANPAFENQEPTFKYVTAIDYTYFEDGRVKSIHVQKIVQAGDPESVYYIGYSYTTNGWTESMVVKTDPANRPWLYRARYSYDGRGQVVSQKYDYFDTTTKTVKNISDITIRYDLAGNVLQKPMLREGASGLWMIGFTYDTGYRWTVGNAIYTDLANPLLNKAFTYTPVYDLRGNITNLTMTSMGPGTVTSPLDLPNVMEYDAYNRMVEFSTGAGATMKTWKLKYDPVGRCFRKEEWLGAAPPELEHATHYYYQGSKLVQEFDETPSEFAPYNPVDEIAWDYLRGQDGRVIRRRDETQQVSTDTFHYNDPVGTAKDDGSTTQGGISRSTNGYVTTAEGEPLSIQGGQPSNVNHIQFHGGFLEGKEWQTALGSGRGDLYRMGVRHYSPALGRFLQRDPLSYRTAPSLSNPKSVNPYVYGMNNSYTYSDRTGFAPCCGGGGGGAPGIGAHPGGGWIGPGIGNPGTSGPWDPGLGGGSDCPLKFPDECKNNANVDFCCCIGENAPEHDSMSDPCGDSVTLPNLCLVSDYMQATNCSKWCQCKKNQGEEFSPSNISFTVVAVFYGPPSLGPFGDGGDSWGIYPVGFFPKDGPFFDDLMGLSSNQLSASCHQMSWKIFKGRVGQIMHSSCKWAAILGLANIGYPAVVCALSWVDKVGEKDICDKFINPAENKRTNCKWKACCNWFKCSTWVGIGTLVALVGITLLSPIKWIAGLSKLACWASLGGDAFCFSRFNKQIRDCDDQFQIDKGEMPVPFVGSKT